MFVFWRRAVLSSDLFLLPLLQLAIFSCSAIAADPANSKPNIVVILSDDQGWADIGYNNPAVYSPNLDRLARSGRMFESHYVMPQCTPTRVALMTGRYPSRFGGAAMSASNLPAFPKGTPTLASMLKQSSYQTYLCGKWHLGSTLQHGPQQFGFDHSYGSLTGAIGMYDHHYRKGKYYRSWHRDDRLIDGAENGVHATDLITEEAIRIIKQDRDQPFFLYLPFHAPHTPLDERGKFVDQPTRIDPDNPNRWLNEDNITWFNDPQGKIQNENDPEKRLLLAAVHHLDYSIGRIVKALDETGQRQNTLILFSSDNGPQGSWPGGAYPNDLKLTRFNQPLPMRGKKLDVWEGGIHVPGFVNWPGKIKPGVSQDLLHIIDWFPTLAALTGAAVDDADLDGKNLLPLLLEDQPLEERSLYWSWEQDFNRWAFRKGKWKLVKYGRNKPEIDDWQLFDLSADPREKRNLAGQFPAIVADLHRQFLKTTASDARQVFQASGVRVGEVDSDSAIVWVRTTRSIEANFNRIYSSDTAKEKSKRLRAQMPIDVVPGTSGKIQLFYQSDG